LVADDNKDAATTLALLLGLMGHETRTANDGIEAIEVAEKFRPDVVLLDIGMPRLNGYDTARRLRQESWGRELLLVALTGWGQEADRLKSSNAGFDMHLVKPVDVAEIQRLLAHNRSTGWAGQTA
jgi:CheY-like chemotaxis protein